MRKILKVLVSTRIYILAVLGISLYIAISQFHISLWYVLLVGTITGVVFGKVFCRWVCPMGLIMEMMMSLSPDGKVRQMYQYHKVGCPIAWISGWLNKFSFLRIHITRIVALPAANATNNAISCPWSHRNSVSTNQDWKNLGAATLAQNACSVL